MDPDAQESFREMAKMGLTLFRGLKEDGATDVEAMMVLTALMAGMLQSGRTDESKP